jgi:drug/metabolite transporter (DMT)-like permease
MAPTVVTVEEQIDQTQPLLGQSSSTRKSQKTLVLGLLLCLLSAILLSVTNIFVKLGAPTIPVSELVLARGVGQLSFSLALCLAKGISPFGDKSLRFWMYLRGIAGGASLCLFYYALSVMPLADASGNNVTRSF